MKNIPDSVRRRLFDVAKEQNVEFNSLLIRYAIERTLYRLSVSEFADRFLLKGALLLSVWSERPYRPTLDVDLLAFGDSSASSMESVFRQILSIPCSDDGLQFLPETMALDAIKLGDEYQGLRVTFRCELAKAVIPVQVDIGFGDAVVPGPLETIYPTILELPVPRVRSYPRETVVAEKFEAMVKLGAANSRMKDFADIFYLASKFEFEGNLLAEALKATFSRRNTELPVVAPFALTENFYLREDRQKQWFSFLKRSKLVDTFYGFSEVCILLRDFLLPPAVSAASSTSFEKRWQLAKGWSAY